MMQSISPQQVTWIARAIGLAMLVLAVFSVYVVATCYESPVDPYALGALHEGASKDEVIAALGEPTSIEDDGHKWLYSRFMKVRVVQVLFDDDDLLLERGYTDDESGIAPQHRGMPEDVVSGEGEWEPGGGETEDYGDRDDGHGLTEVMIE